MPQDFVLAYMWVTLAVSQGKGYYREMVADRPWYRLAAELRDEIEERMTREQINKAQRLAREWKPKGSGSQ